MAAFTKYKHNGTPCVLTHYSSVSEMEHDVHRAMFRSANTHKQALVEQGKLGGGVSWYGIEGGVDAVKRTLIEGYQDGATMVDKLYDAIAPSLPRAVDFRRKPIRGDQGDTLDIHAVNRGDLAKAWTRTTRKANTGTGLVRIAVDICGNAYVTAEQLKWRGVAALALARAMVKAGYSVEIVAGQSGKGAFSSSDAIGTITVTVKPRYTPLDTATLAATVCLPGFFRYLGFLSIIRQADDIGSDVRGGLGRAVKLESALPVPEKIAQVIVPETIDNEQRAVAWIKEALTLLQGSTVAKEQS